MKRKVRKFRLGGGTDEMGGKASYEESPPDFEAPKKKSFSEAFREARKAGDATFMWQGKKYTTELKEEAEKPRSSKKDDDEVGALPKGPSTRGSRRKSNDDETPGRRFGGVYGETREALASLSPEQKKRALKAGVAGAAGIAGAGALGAMGAEGAAAGAGSRMIAGERGLEMARRMETAARMEKYRRQMEAASKLSRGSVYKKGGMVKSSASRRADGIAQRGKTRGKIY